MLLQNVISINNRCVDQIGNSGNEHWVRVIAELHRAVALIQHVVLTTAATAAGVVEVPPSDAPHVTIPSPITAATTVRIQFRPDAVSSRSAVPHTEYLQHSTSPIVACLCPIYLVADDSMIEHSTAVSSSSSSSPSRNDLHLISTTVLLNIGMIFHRLAIQPSKTTSHNTNSPMVQGPPGSAPYSKRAMELYELLLQLLHTDAQQQQQRACGDSSDGNCYCCCTTGSCGGGIHTTTQQEQHIVYMTMMKTILYNNYAQFCYDMGHVAQYVSCITALYHQLLLHPVRTTPVPECDAIATAVTASSSSSSRLAQFEPIRDIIQLNVLVCQLMTIPNLARAA